MNHTWGYKKDDTRLEVARTIIFKLVDIVSKGGNYLLNVGPTADGTIPQAEPGHPAHRRPLAARSTARRSTARARRRSATSSANRARGARRTCAASRCSSRGTSGA